MKKNNLKNELCQEFATNAAGVNWQAKNPNYEHIVLACETLEKLYPTTLVGDEAELPHLNEQLKAISQILESINDEDSQIDAYYLTEFIQTLESTPRSFDLVCIYEIILAHWDVLQNNTRTYRTLADLIHLSNWQPDAKEEGLILLALNSLQQE